jgi:hypothetical protein
MTLVVQNILSLMRHCGMHGGEGGHHARGPERTAAVVQDRRMNCGGEHGAAGLQRGLPLCSVQDRKMNGGEGIIAIMLLGRTARHTCMMHH